MQLKKFIFFFLVAILLHVDFAASATSTWNENENKSSKTRLIASFYEKDGTKKLIAGIHFKISEGWKIYGNESGGIGLPPSFDFKGSKNYAGHQVLWPQAIVKQEKIGKETLQYSIYKDEVIIPIFIEIKNNNEPVELALRVDFGLCKDICIPASESFSLKIPAEIDEKSLQEIQKFSTEKIIKNILPPQEDPKKSTPNFGLISALILAILGGAILNIMPCVLPVLSIKLISVINHSNASLARVRFSFISTIIGILSCFVFFAILASAIKITGNSLGWGLQFQNPYFLIFLTLVLMFFIANLLGIFEISFEQIFATILNKKISEGAEKKNIFIPNFLSGILAVLLATPCSAPFLGSAISFALVQNYLIIFLIFIAIGLGFALPYLILLISPKLVYLLPKSGEWMFKTKQLMAGLLAATVVWLIFVVSGNIGFLPACLLAVLAVILFGCFKIKSEFLKYLTIIVVITASFTLPMDFKKRQEAIKQSYESMWHEFDEAEIYRLVAQGKTVLVDVTADWCITCKFNKIRVLQDEEIVIRIRRGDVIAMRGDITKPNEEIMNFLRKNNRFAIPFNAVYGPSAPTGLLASELLNKKELIELIEKAR